MKKIWGTVFLVSTLLGLVALPNGTASAKDPVKLKVSSPSVISAGGAFSVKVRAVQRGRLVRNFAGKIRLEVVDAGPSSKLPPAYRFRARDRGVHTFRGIVLTRATSQTVSAIDIKRKSIKGRVTIKVSPAPLAALDLSGQALTDAGRPASFTVEGRDQYGNVRPDTSSSVQLSISPDGDCAGLSCTATKKGPHTVTASSGNASDSFEVEVSPAAMTELELSPSTASVAPLPPQATQADFTGIGALDFQSYEVNGFDEYGNSYGNVTQSTTFQISPDGSCSGASCSALLPGIHTVTAVSGDANGSATLTAGSYASNYSMTCRGQNYDVNADIADGCEQTTVFMSATTESTAYNRGSYSECDEPTTVVSSSYLSDARTHSNPSVSAFDSNTGSTPLWFKFGVSDETLCAADGKTDLLVTGASQPACYELTVKTRTTSLPGSQKTTSATVETSASGFASVSPDYLGPTPAIDDDSAVFTVSIRKTCAGPVPEQVGFKITTAF